MDAQGREDSAAVPEMTTRKAVWLGVIVIVIGALAFAASGALTAIRLRDEWSIEIATEAIRQINTFCTTNGRLPDARQLEQRFPGLSTDTGWFYRLLSDGRSATLQYPMAAIRFNAPGTRKVSESTGTTYAYETRVSCAAAGQGDLVRNPYQMAWEDEGSVEGLVRFFLDLNQDGQPELFVGAKALLGQGGGPFRIFENMKPGWMLIGEVFIHPGAVEVLASRHSGFADLRYCGKVNADACMLTTYAFDGTAYVRLAPPLEVTGAEIGERAFARTTPEESGLRLTWR
jgi:hypothetical protein